MGFFLWLFFFCKINVNIYVTICKLYNSKGAIMATIIKTAVGSMALNMLHVTWMETLPGI